jgi:hypothetical protein
MTNCELNGKEGDDDDAAKASQNLKGETISNIYSWQWNWNMVAKSELVSSGGCYRRHQALQYQQSQQRHRDFKRELSMICDSRRWAQDAKMKKKIIKQ